MAGLDVFVSYASADRRAAEDVHGWLTAAGHRVFLDHHPTDGIAAGEEWERRLHERLRRCDVVVCLLTDAYLGSPWCTAEIAIARSRGSRVLPLAAAPGARHPLIAALQTVDLTADPAAARKAALDSLGRIAGSARRGWPDDRNPFPGLRPFEPDEHLAFFGRAGDVERITELLRSPGERAALVVVGPSGCGKSSTVRAGVLPRIAEEDGWLALPPVVPGRDPVEALAAALTAAGPGWTLPLIRARLAADELGQLINELLLAGPGEPRRQLLIVVDQLEQLLTLTPAAERERFTGLLLPVLDGRVRLLATLRPEFLGPLLADPVLAGLHPAVHPIAPLGRAALRLVVEGPAELRALTVPEELLAALVDDTGSGTALPLLAFTLARLAEGVERGSSLSHAAYRELGGVAGALQAQADAALADAVAAGAADEAEVLAGLLDLVTVDASGNAGQRPVPLDELPEPVAAALSVFVGRRLLVTTTSDDGRVTISAAHETLLSVWPPLHAAIASRAAALRARNAVESAAGEWVDHDRSRDRLWEKGRLAAALADLGVRPRRRVALGPGTTEPLVHVQAAGTAFLRASVRRDRFLRSRLAAVLSVLLAAALVLTLVVVDRGNRLDDRLRAANAEILGTAATTRAPTDPALAAKLALSAWRSDPTAPGARDALVRGYLALQSAQTVVDGVTDQPIRGMSTTPDGRTIALRHTGAVTVVTDLLGPDRATWEITGMTDDVDIEVSPDGRRLVAANDRDELLVWDIQRRTGPVTLWPAPARPAGSARRIAFSADGTQLIAMRPGASGSEVARWDLTTSARLAVPPGLLRAPPGTPEGSVVDVRFTGDPTLLVVQYSYPEPATGDVGQTVATWSLVDGAVRTVLFSGSQTENDVDVVAGGSLLATCQPGDDMLERSSRIGFRDTATGAERSAISALDDSRCGRGKLTADDGYFLEDGSIGTDEDRATIALRPVPRPGHPDELAVIAAGQPVLLWGLAEGRATADLPVESAGAEAVFSPSGDRLAVLRTDGNIEEWDVDSRTRARGPYFAPGVQQLIGYTTDGYLIAGLMDDNVFRLRTDNVLQLWDMARGTISGTVGLADSQAVSLSDEHDPLQLDGVSRMPTTLPLTAERWVDRLCPLLPDYTPAQRAALPFLATAPAPCPS